MTCDNCEITINPVSAVRVGSFRYCADCAPDDECPGPVAGHGCDECRSDAELNHDQVVL